MILNLKDFSIIAKAIIYGRKFNRYIKAVIFQNYIAISFVSFNIFREIDLLLKQMKLIGNEIGRDYEIDTIN